MAVKFQFRRDTAANWESNNPILSEGEFGLDLTNQRFKIGDGVNTWNNIEFSQYTNKAETFDDTFTISGTNGGNSDWIEQQSGPWQNIFIATKSVSGILTTDNPLIDIDFSSFDASNYDAVRLEYQTIFRAESSAINEIKFYASAPLTLNIPIIVKVVR